jgi:cell division protein FtsA
MIQQEIKRSGYDGLLPAGIVLSGGTAQLSGIQELSKDVFGLPVRVGIPRDLYGLIDRISTPPHAVGAGLMGWGVTMDTRPQFHKPVPNFGGRFIKWLRALLPG